MHQLAFVRGHRSPFTLSREKQIPVGPSLCTTHPSLKKKKNISIPDFFYGRGRLYPD